MVSPLQTLLLASSNPGKLAELKAMLDGLPVRVLAPAEMKFDLPDVIEDGESFMVNAGKKARSAARAAAAAGREDLWVLADDSGLAVTALGGAPGIRSARYAPSDSTACAGDRSAVDRRNLEHLLHELRDVAGDRRQARFLCALVLAHGEQLLVSVESAVEGYILEHPRGEGGFGYDPVFFHPPSASTFAAMAPAQKAAVSHRGMAMCSLRHEIDKLFRQRSTHG